MTENPRLSDLQFSVMRILWDQGEATVADVHTALHDERGLAPTTVATLLSRLEKRNLVSHRSEGRQFVYRALVSEQDVRRTMVTDLTELLFEGDAAELMSHLLDARDFSADDLARVKSIIEAQEKGGGKPSGSK